MNGNILGIDLGTQSVKVVFYEPDTRRTVAVASAPLELIRDEHGTAEQLTEWWLAALESALESVDAGVRARVRAIGVSGQQHGLVAIDAAGESLVPVKLWCDTATGEEVAEITAACGGRERAIALTGNPVLAGYTAPKIRWLKKHRPQAYARATHFLLPHDYFNYVLTGVLAMEHGDASGTGLLDVRRREWSREMLAAVDAERDLAAALPPLVAPDAIVGRTTPEAAQRFGLPAGVPVSAGGGDNMMGAIGTGNVSPGKLTMSLGTSGTLYAYSDSPVVDPQGNIAAFCSSTGGWLPLLCTMNCTLATELVRAPLAVGIDELDATIAAAPPGADGLVVLPFFTGERTPDLPKAKACFIGLTPTTSTKAHMLRATVEGATFALKFGIDELASLGMSAEEIVLTGGGANSRVWRSIVADACNLPVTVLEQQEGAAFGAALQALWTLERQTSPALAIEDITGVHLSRDRAACTMPDAERAAVYAHRYAAYQRALRQVAPLFGAV